jgi:hypothetical protein
MADLIRSVKLGSDWSHNKLRAYNMEVLLTREAEFFGRKANGSLENIQQGPQFFPKRVWYPIGA